MPKLKELAIPNTKKMVMRFLGIVNYYRNHIPGLAAVAAPLYELLSSKTKMRWTPKCQEAFEKVKEICQNRVLLVPYKEGGKLELYTDASDVAAGAVLLQDGLPLEFYSRRFTPTEQRYSTNEREALALVSSILHFKYLLMGHKFTAYTDHIALTRWLQKEPVSERHACCLTKVQGMVFDIQYAPGEKNVFADLMSRPEGVAKSTRKELLQTLQSEAIVHMVTFDHERGLTWMRKLREAQDEEMIAGMKLSPQEICIVAGLKCLVPSEGLEPKILVPASLRMECIKRFHDIGHPGRKRTRNKVSREYFWPKLPRDVTSYIKACESCQGNKVVPAIRREYPGDFQI